MSTVKATANASTRRRNCAQPADYAAEIVDVLDRPTLARIAEAETARRLEARGFAILGRNVRVGRLEIDLVAARAGRVIAVEVRGRSSIRYGHPAETVDARKRARVRRAFAAWLARERVRATSTRLDVAALVVGPRGEIRSFRYYADAF